MDSPYSLLNIPAEVFPDTYQQGCRLWENALERLALPYNRSDFPYPINSRDGAPMITQTALIGNPDAPATLVLISATHGVEGFAGTAVQCDLLGLLDRVFPEPPADVSVLLINALNPWGYHYCHRHDHLGIDVNRNFVDFANPLPDNPGYRELQAIFRIGDSRRQLKALREAATRMGDRDYEVAFSGGQYHDALGPFYGGSCESHSRQVIESLIARHELGSRRLAVIDVHTGLGPYGYGEAICDHPADDPGLEVAREWYGPACTSVDGGTSSSVPKTGLLDYAWHRIMDEKSCFITLEFGTLGTESLFKVLLEDKHNPAQPWHYGRADLREHFYPDDPYWREAVIFRGRQVFLQALAGIRK